MKKIAILLCLLLSPIFVFANRLDAIIVTQKKPEFTIAIPGNPTTGYSWYLKNYDTKLIQPISHKYIANKNRKLLGAPGTFEFVFKVLPQGFIVPQSTDVEFVYARPWMSVSYTTKTFVIRTSQ